MLGSGQTAEGQNVVIVGAGLAGLTAAVLLHRLGVHVAVLEAADQVGGRVRTDTIESSAGPVLLDRGFQVYLDAYPEGRALLDYDDLDLGAFEAGAIVFGCGGPARVADPFRDPVGAAKMLGSPVMTPLDAARFAMLDRELRESSEAAIWSRPEQSAIELLRDVGLSERAIDGFFRPFFGGVFFDGSLRTSARMLAFTYRMFAEGRACLPAGGMQRIPEQLASRLDPGAVRVRCPVDRVAPGEVVLGSGERLAADEIVVATDQDAAARLLAGSGFEPKLRTGGRWRSTAMLAFLADEAPTGATLALDGAGTGPVNHLAAPSAAAKRYAAGGRHVIYANVIEGVSGTDWLSHEDHSLLSATQDQLRGWFGRAVDAWEPLGVHRVTHALPEFFAPALSQPERPARVAPGLLIAGDHHANASINGAMASGRRAAAAVMRSLHPTGGTT